MDIFKQNCHSSINNSSCLSTYNRFKHIFEYEKYLDIIHESKYRISLTKLRLSSHELAVESGRKHNIPENERTCKNCYLGLIENEYYFLLVCPKFSISDQNISRTRSITFRQPFKSSKISYLLLKLLFAI